MRHNPKSLDLMTCTCGQMLRIPPSQLSKRRKNWPNDYDYTRQCSKRDCHRRWHVTSISYHDPDCTNRRPCSDITHLCVTKKWEEVIK